VERVVQALGVPVARIGVLNEAGGLRWSAGNVDVTVAEMARAWLGTLDW
jgi:hypothetical protein